MEIKTRPFTEDSCFCFRQYFCYRRKRQWNPINSRNPRVKRERSKVTFASKVNKVEPLQYESIEERDSEDNSIHTVPNGHDKKDDDITSTTALLDKRLSDSDESEANLDDYDQQTLEGKEAFVENYIKETLEAALKQFKRDTEEEKRKVEVENLKMKEEKRKMEEEKRKDEEHKRNVAEEKRKMEENRRMEEEKRKSELQTVVRIERNEFTEIQEFSSTSSEEEEEEESWETDSD